MSIQSCCNPRAAVQHNAAHPRHRARHAHRRERRRRVALCNRCLARWRACVPPPHFLLQRGSTSASSTTFSSFARSQVASASRFHPRSCLFRRTPPQPLTRVQHIIDAFQSSIIDAIVNLFQVLNISRFKTTLRFAFSCNSPPPPPTPSNLTPMSARSCSVLCTICKLIQR